MGQPAFEVIHYKGWDLMYNFYGKGEYTIQHDDADIWFDTAEEAKKFVDEIVEEV